MNQKLIELGYAPSVADRILRRAPELAARLLKNKGGVPSDIAYHGMDVHPYDSKISALLGASPFNSVSCSQKWQIE